jgi:hypothetical protein
MTLLIGDDRWITIQPGQSITLETNAQGRCEVAWENDNLFRQPTFTVKAPFSEKTEAFAFLMKSHALHEISRLNGTSS